MSDSTIPVIVAACRTPIGKYLGGLAGFTAPQLGALAIREAVRRAGIDAGTVDDVIMGQVVQGGSGQAPARQAMIHAGLPSTIPALTINKVCGSGMKAVMLAHDAIVAGSREVVLAGGMESMTNAPYLLAKGRQGYRYGHATVYDHMAQDGLEDAYERGKAMGVFAESCAAKYGFTREQQDAYAIDSLKRAQTAIADGSFKWEVAPVTVKGKAGDTEIANDEQPPKAKLDKIPTLKPAFIKDGTITAANASSISDGAAALVLMKASKAAALGLKPLARIVAHAEHAQEPAWFATAPAGAMKKVFTKAGWTPAEVDLYEINEAFANVTMAAMKEFDLPREKVNIHGGACALGHPIGASGARILVTLIGALRKTGGKKGVASLCIGGGEATAVAIEMI